MNFLSSKTVQIWQKMFPSMGQIATSRISSFITFSVNLDGSKLIHDPDAKYRNQNNIIKSQRIQIRKYLNQQNNNYLLGKYLLQAQFHNHIIDNSQGNRIYDNLAALNLMSKQDLINAMFKNKMKLQIDKNQNSKLEEYQVKVSADSSLPQNDRKNFYVIQKEKITKYQQLESILHNNKLLSLPNINKILCLNIQKQSFHEINRKIIQNQSFFLELNIKVKNINYSQSSLPKQLVDYDIPLELINQAGLNVYKVIQYVYKKHKGNILLHQFPQYYQFYSKLANYRNSQKVMSKFSPLQIILFIIRTKQINKKCRFYQTLSDKFINRDEESQYQQDSTGLMIKRFISKHNKLKFAKILFMEKHQQNEYNN